MRTKNNFTTIDSNSEDIEKLYCPEIDRDENKELTSIQATIHLGKGFKNLKHLLFVNIFIFFVIVVIFLLIILNIFCFPKFNLLPITILASALCVILEVLALIKYFFNEYTPEAYIEKPKNIFEDTSNRKSPKEYKEDILNEFYGNLDSNFKESTNNSPDVCIVPEAKNKPIPRPASKNKHEPAPKARPKFKPKLATIIETTVAPYKRMCKKEKNLFPLYLEAGLLEPSYKDTMFDMSPAPRFCNVFANTENTPIDYSVARINMLVDFYKYVDDCSDKHNAEEKSNGDYASKDKTD